MNKQIERDRNPERGRQEDGDMTIDIQTSRQRDRKTGRCLKYIEREMNEYTEIEK